MKNILLILSLLVKSNTMNVLMFFRSQSLVILLKKCSLNFLSITIEDMNMDYLSQKILLNFLINPKRWVITNSKVTCSSFSRWNPGNFRWSCRIKKWDTNLTWIRIWIALLYFTKCWTPSKNLLESKNTEYLHEISTNFLLVHESWGDFPHFLRNDLSFL